MVSTVQCSRDGMYWVACITVECLEHGRKTGLRLRGMARAQRRIVAVCGKARIYGRYDIIERGGCGGRLLENGADGNHRGSTVRGVAY